MKFLFDNLPDPTKPLDTPVYLLRGHVEGCETGTVRVSANMTPEVNHFDVVDGCFKLWLQLSSGENVWILQCGDAEAVLKYTYKTRSCNQKMRLAVIMAADSEGTFDCPDPAVYQGRWKEAITNKLRTAAAILQMYMTDELQQGHVEGKAFPFAEEDGEFEVCFVRLPETVAELQVMDYSELANHVKTELDEIELPESVDYDYLAVVLDSHWDGHHCTLDPVCTLDDNFLNGRIGIIGSLGMHSWPETLQEAWNFLHDHEVTPAGSVANVCELYDEMDNGSTILEESDELGEESPNRPFCVGEIFERTMSLFIECALAETDESVAYHILDRSRSLDLEAKFLPGLGKESHMTRRLLLEALSRPTFRYSDQRFRDRVSFVSMKESGSMFIVSCAVPIYLVELVCSGEVIHHWEFLPQNMGGVGTSELWFNIEDICGRIPLGIRVQSALRVFNVLGYTHTVKLYLPMGHSTEMIGFPAESYGLRKYTNLPLDPSQKVSRIRVNKGGAIDGVTVFYEDGTSAMLGSHHCEHFDLVLDSDEEVTSLEISKGFEIDGLKFATSKNHGGQFQGTFCHENYTEVIPKGHRLTGFYGFWDDFMRRMGATYE